MIDPTPLPPAECVPNGRYTVIARRYRPQSFDELVGQEHVARALQLAISSGRVGHAYLFTGARGVGKTSAARILAKALLKTLEEPPEHVKFIFATTEPQKIPITILSRCQRFDFAGVSSAAIQARLAQIAAAEGVAVEPEALQILASRAAGSMRDSQSLLEQLLAMGHERISAADVNQLLGIAPAERLNGLVRHLVARDPSAALAELDATIQSGVEGGLLLDQLVGYFRDVMTTTVGFAPDQMLYALPSQAAEVTEVGRQLGLSTVLAIGQILDHTGARLRVSMHARTLVEMAIVRICQIGEMEDLAALVAELRGTTGQPSSKAAAEGRTTGGLQAGFQAQVDVKKNDEPRPAMRGLTVATPPNSIETSSPITATQPVSAASAPSEQMIRREDAAHPPGVPTTEANGISESAVERESVLAQFKQAMANGGLSKSESPSPRVSRREQLAQVAEQPIVRRAMELFDVAPDKMRYTPPEGESN